MSRLIITSLIAAVVVLAVVRGASHPVSPPAIDPAEIMRHAPLDLPVEWWTLI